MLYLFVFKYL